MIYIIVVTLLLILLYICFILPLSKVYVVDHFKRDLNLHKLPLVSMYEGPVKLKFVLDTGSTDSYIVPSALKNVHYTEDGVNNNPLYSYGSVTDVSNQKISMTLDHEGVLAYATFLVSEVMEETLSQAFPNTTVHGILGSDFLKKNGYIIDYSDFTIKKRK